jgi:AraC family transcriptional regulator
MAMLNLECGEYLGSTRRKYDAGGVVVSEIEYHERVFEGWHFHKNRHITFIVSGGNREQRKHAEVEASPGAVMIYNSGELHRNLNTLHPSKNINIEIDDVFFINHSLDPSSFQTLSPENPELRLSALKAYRECLVDDANSILAIHAILLNLLGPQRRDRMSHERPPWVRRVKDAIHDRWDEKLSLKELSRVAGVHPVTISKNFSKYFACSLGDYIRRVKIEKSLCLIKQKNTTLTEVAFRSGFADQSHFIRTFKAATGFLPKEYKNL